jgi:hypothetical protein
MTGENTAQPRPCRRLTAWGLFLLIVLPAILQAPALWKGEAPEFMDVLTTFYPIRTHAAHLLAEGQLPFWNRSVYAGVPLLANPQWGLLYPGHWPFLLAPNARVFTAINIAHIAWMGIGVFVWLRRALRQKDGRKPLAGPLLGGFLTQVGGWTWAHLAFGAYLQAAAWMPWMLWTFERSREEWEGASGRWTRSAFLWVAAGGLAGAMQWLVGAPQLALYCQAGTLLYILLTGWMRGRTVRALAAALLWVGVAEATALGLSAPQWMTAREFMSECERQSGLTQAEVAAGAVSLRGLTQAWVGGTGQPEDAEQILYPGWVALALALTAAMGTGISRVRRPSISSSRLAREHGDAEGERDGSFRRIQKSCLSETVANRVAPEGAKGSSRGWSEAEPPEEITSLSAPEGRSENVTGTSPRTSKLPDSPDGSFESEGFREKAVSRNEDAVVMGLSAVLLSACLLSWKGAVPVLFQIPLLGSFHDPRRALFLAFFSATCLAAVGFQMLWDFCTAGHLSSLPADEPNARPTFPAVCTVGVPADAATSAPPSRISLLFRLLLVSVALLACADPLGFVWRRVDVKTIPESEFRNERFAPLEALAPQGEESFSEKTAVPPPTVPPEPRNDRVRFFACDMGIQYSYNYTRAGFGRSLMPCLPAFYGLEDIGGYDPMIPWRYALYMRRLNSLPTPTPSLYPRHFGLVRNPDSPWLPRFGSVTVRGPVDCYWPFVEPKWLPPGETVRVDLTREGRSWQADAKALEAVRAYLAFGRFEGRGDQGHELELRFLSGRKVVALARAVGCDIESNLENPDADGIRLWPDVLEPKGLFPGLTLTPVHRGLIEKVQIAGEKGISDSQEGVATRATLANKPLTIDAIEVHNPGGKLAVLLYSLGLPRPLALYRPVGEPNALGEFDTFVSTWEPGFPDKIAVERAAETDTPEGRRACEERAMRQPSTETRVELTPGDPEPPVPAQSIRGWRWMERRANHLRVALPEGHAGGWLVLPEPFARGWTARVDGAPASIHPADVLFRAVPVPAGAREVTLRFCPTGLTTGIAMAGLTVLFLALGVLRTRLRA